MQAKLHRVLLWSSLALVVILFAVLPFPMLMIDGFIVLVSPHWIVFAAVLTSIIAGVISMVVPVKNWTPEKFCKSVSGKFENDKPRIICSVTKKQFAPWIILLVYGIGLTVGMSVASGFLLRGYMITFIFAAVAFAGFIVGSHFVAKRDGDLAKVLYGKGIPANNARPIVYYNEYNQIQAYEAYKKADKASRHAYDDENTNKSIKKNMLGVICSGGGIVLFAILALVLSPVLTDKFSASYVSDMPRDLRPSQVVCYLGEPTDIIYDDDDTYHSYYNAREFIYLDGEYEDLYLELKSIEKRIENNFTPSASDLARIETIENKMSAMDYKYLVVEFTDNNNSYPRVYSIQLNKLENDSKETVKTISEIKFTPNTILRYSNPSSQTFEAEVFYGDGSYRFAPISGHVFSDVDTSKLGAQSVTWEDNWGTTTTTVTVSDNVTATYAYGDNSVDYTITINNGNAKSDEYTATLAFKNYKSNYGSTPGSDFFKNAPWNGYKSFITSVSFDGTIPNNYIDYMIANDSSSTSYSMAYWNKLESVSVASGGSFTSADGALIESGNTLVFVPRAKTGDYTVPSGVISISGGAFGNTSLSNIIIGKQVKRVGSYAISSVNEYTVYVADHYDETRNYWYSDWATGDNKTIYYGAPRAGGTPNIEFETHTCGIGGSPSVSGYTISAEGVISALPTPIYSGYRFVGWGKRYNIDTQTVSDMVELPYTVKGDTTIFAKWERVYTVSFSTNGGSSIDSIDAPSIATCPVTTKFGYYFQGWYTSSSLSGSPVAFPYTPDMNRTLYAKWSDSAYNVTYKLSASDSTAYSTLTDVAYIQSFPAEPTRSGYTFIGWVDVYNDINDPTDLSSPTVSAPMVLTRSTTLVAMWATPDQMEQYYNGSTQARAINVSDPTDFTKTVSYSSSSSMWFKVTVAVSGTYIMESTNLSTSSFDPYGYLYLGSSQISSNDDGGDGYNFRISRNLTAGETYYLKVNGWSTGYSCTVSITKN